MLTKNFIFVIFAIFICVSHCNAAAREKGDCDVLNNESWNEEGGCEASCDTSEMTLLICAGLEYIPGCECNAGYVRHEGRCILKEECPNKHEEL